MLLISFIQNACVCGERGGEGRLDKGQGNTSAYYVLCFVQACEYNNKIGNVLALLELTWIYRQ